MNLIRHSDARYEAKLAKLAAASSLFDPVIEQRTLNIVRGVERDGDKALLNFTKQFDGASLRAADLAIPAKRLAEAWNATQPGTKRAIRLAKANVASFAKQSLRKNWKARNTQGGSVGEKFDPFQRVGVYIPGGTAGRT